MKPVNLSDFRQAARLRIEPCAFDYIDGGAEDEVTLNRNRQAFQELGLRPRTLVDVSSIDLSRRILGCAIPFPVLLAPTAFQTLVHPQGELAAARAAGEAGTVLVASTMSSFPLEEIEGQGRGDKWFQLYCYKDREVTRHLVDRAASAGYKAICLTVDVPRVGRRERDLRNSLRLPQHARPRNFERVADLQSIPLARQESALAKYVESLLDPSLTWKDLEWLRATTQLPLLVKGVLTAEDALKALDCGVDGIVVSNHGGRQLDGAPASIEVLEEVVQAVDGRAEVLMDGGVRRGTDVLKALALGARATLIGRPYLYGLGLEGQQGVEKVLTLLAREIETAMALCGCPRLDDVTQKLLHL